RRDIRDGPESGRPDDPVLGRADDRERAERRRVGVAHERRHANRLRPPADIGDRPSPATWRLTGPEKSATPVMGRGSPGLAGLSGRVALLLRLGEQGANLLLTEAAVAAQRADRGELADLGPAGHRLGVDAEDRGHLT